MSRWLRLVALAVAALCLGGSIDASPTYAYDVPDAAHVSVHELRAVGATTAVRSGADGSVSRPIVARGASTIPFARSVATEAASGSGALRSVNEILDGMPKGNQSWVRMVPDESSLMTKFNELTEGGTPTTWKNFDGAVIERSDGVQVGLRGTSGSGGGAIDIRMPDGSRIRIHVEQP
jgi:hypothetical protein